MYCSIQLRSKQLNFTNGSLALSQAYPHLLGKNRTTHTHKHKGHTLPLAFTLADNSQITSPPQQHTGYGSRLGSSGSNRGNFQQPIFSEGEKAGMKNFELFCIETFRTLQSIDTNAKAKIATLAMMREKLRRFPWQLVIR
ncbi:conserved hypothetical protein [Trichinella spiralis]|uniref:hypothetical protein n=1 Tax=Trichinella spiralis TaxID=6334 RepID=UPI0001EFD7DC|nr:conserved hypothetical protein [Trichinella spiralis]